MKRPLTQEELSHRRGRRPKSGVVEIREYIKGTYRCRRIVRRTDDGKDTVTFITNVLDQDEMSAEQICETYRRRWAIECLFKKLKQNFPLKYFLGDNVGNYVNFVTLLNCPKQAWAERLRYWNSLETAQNTVQLELRFSP